ncbi:glycosyltransferase family 9 protein [Hyunsoonleella pacifica]|uniref:Glycosyltransferase family 9 protein n=1 Tax=Hyunsoonleella pacifica TaxID=1080224 RepID=A0A4Q9FR54_9FLAO|nr:glycosyltransferase family 9 protein [Hyunsoonleella pacifica]TBN16751.1 glycosyltransferase family 9 protein [Hyunsoonleella pacifica]GGD16716.1 heptosyltransferase [Hyunsoonleella pacifica]
MSKPEKNILVIRLSAMGDVAMTVPVLKALTEQHTALQVTVLTKPFFKPLFRDINNINVITADVKGKHKGVLGLYKLGRVINKSHKFYAIADLHNVLRSKILKQFIDCKRFVTIDKGRKEKQQLTSGKLFKELKTTHQRYADVFNALGYPIDLLEPSFPKPVVLKDGIETLIGDNLSGCIGIAPFAAHDGKMYPLNLMQEIVKTLSSNYKIILFGGGKNETAILNSWEKFNKNTVSLADKLSLDEELDVISNLDVMLSMDSGNAHLAAMLGIKVVTIWGVTHPYAGFAPFNQPKDYALLSDRKKFPLIPTSVYGNKLLKGYEKVAASILPETVVDKVKAVIS